MDRFLEVFRVLIKKKTDRLGTDEVWRDRGDGGQDFSLGSWMRGAIIY